MLTKNEWRKEIKKRASGLNDHYRYWGSRRILRFLRQFKAYKDAKTVMIYHSTGFEVITTNVLTKVLSDGKRVCLPKCENFDAAGKRIEGMEATITAREFGHGFKLTRGAFGLIEPSAEATVIDPKEIDLVVLPCICCDKKGNRLGHGGGYYDRYLKQLRPDCWKIALCYDKLMVDELPVDSYDERMDLVITNNKCWGECPISKSGLFCRIIKEK